MSKIETIDFIHIDLSQINEKLDQISDSLKEIATQLKMQNEKSKK